MGWNDCGAYGHPEIRTPNIDKLAAEGIRFDRAYLTCSSCSPSRCSMLTGRYPHSTGAGELHLPLPKDQVLFTTPLRAAGYYTASVGKWHLGKDAESQMDLVKTGGGPGGEGHWVPVLKDRPQEKPFFLWLAATDPHRSYKPGAIDPPHTADDTRVPPFFPDTKAVRQDLALYYDEIGRFDEYIGKVVAELKVQGVLDNTLILVISDNGRPFPRCKTTVLEDGVKTPFVLRFPPLVKGGQTTNELVSTVDIGPSVLELAGVKPLASCQGVSFLPILKGGSSLRTATFSEHNWHDYQAFERSVCDKDFRYVRNFAPDLAYTPPADAVRSPTFAEMKRLFAAGKLNAAQSDVFRKPREQHELYDIHKDPHCLKNLADDPAFAKQLAKQQATLKDHMDKTNDAFPGAEKLTPDGFDRTDGTRLPHVKSSHPTGKPSGAT
ncbi:UNVERIFIED_CONTAM: hypothetical protein GTU68_011330 [Idotea baltica]|nr:hypothetical protein [Idotea baltica]